jgi:hypothetical protein
VLTFVLIRVHVDAYGCWCCSGYLLTLMDVGGCSECMLLMTDGGSDLEA